MTKWIEIGALSDIPVLGSRVVRTPSGNIAVFRTGDDEVFALDDRCPHKGGCTRAHPTRVENDIVWLCIQTAAAVAAE